MKILNIIISTIFTISGICLAFFFLTVWAAKPDLLLITAGYIEKNMLVFGLIGTGMILMGIIWAVNWFDHIYKTKVVSFDNPNGKIKISLRAIENYINSMLIKQIKDIHSLRVKTVISSKGLNTTINLKLFSHFNIPELCTQIQEVTKNYLQDAIGIERIGNIEIFISRIKSNGAQETTEDTTDEENDTQEEEKEAEKQP
ncbi:MAG TPA: alkaline shock response membrane anchor protein AmaP [bacterium]|nr:alkaline shock response membrane anchor protein AmaP [bacterium]